MTADEAGTAGDEDPHADERATARVRQAGGVAAPGGQGELTGLSGWASDVVDAMGEVGLGLLVALENVFPPIPSEPILTLAGVLSAQGGLSLALVVLCSTLGSVLGALVLYGVGARTGRARVVRLVDRLPLVDVDDLERAEAWFARHGTKAVLLGRFIPVVRSLVSVPAGFERLPLRSFVLLTALGSGIWNTAFVLLGYAAGDSVDLDVLSRVLDYGVYAAAVVCVVLGVRRLRRNRAAARQTGPHD